MVVTGTFEPIPLEDVNRTVVSLPLSDADRGLYSSFVDYLSEDSSVDLEQRGINGVQADLSIRGSSFGQNLVLLDGLRLNDAQTGHHNLDIPVPLEAISRIEILHGAGSTLYGADAVGGAVNFITAQPKVTELHLSAAGGSYGANEERVLGAFRLGDVLERLSASRAASDGFEPDRDYRSSSVASETWFHSRAGLTDLLVSGSDKPFGASEFYGDFPSWERTKNWFAGLNQQLWSQTSLAFGYRRHSDEFVLVRDNPTLYENNHVSQSWQLAVRRQSELPKNLILSYGIDAERDQIDSNNLGRHARERGAGYLNLDLQYFHRVSVSLGGREEVLSGGFVEFSPSLAGALWMSPTLKIKASVGRAFRVPTYTDLYYQDPANIGNPYLRPETAWDYEAGPEWAATNWSRLYITLFHRHDHDDIDYVRENTADPWRASNVQDISFNGIETSVRLAALHNTEQLQVGYTVIGATQQTFPGMSEYVFNYPHHRATVSWLAQPVDGISIRSRLSLMQRAYNDPYAVWDIAASINANRIRPFIQLMNVTDSRYQEIPGVTMPGRSFIAGFDVVLEKASHK